ncbi:MAG: ABC transporter substrate binding protein [Pseudomonadota bacterium]
MKRKCFAGMANESTRVLDKCRLLFILIALFLATRAIVTFAAEESGPIGVIYPEVDEPYLGIFLQMIDGIKEGTRGEVVTYRLTGGADANALNAWAHDRSLKRIILLGRQSIKVARLFDPSIRVVAGGALITPAADMPTLGAVSLAPDPELLFKTLKRSAPSVERVIVIYSPTQNRWLMELARESAKRQGLELITHEVKDLRAAVLEYQDVLAKMQSKRDALWLPLDANTLNEELVLPLILKEAWEKSLLVFSCNISHAKKGVLFSLYPDNQGWGRELARLAYSAKPPGVSPLKALRSAINLRTASHLGLTVDQTQFNTMFPEP